MNIMDFPKLGKKSITLDKLQDWLDLQIASVDITLNNLVDLPQADKSYYYGEIAALECVKVYIHELVK